MHWDYIEIGTSDFGTLIGSIKQQSTGISIEPIKPYFDNLPARDGWFRYNCAITPEDGYTTVHYVDPEKITNEPNWVRGCNSIGEPHPIIAKRFPHLGGSRVSVRTMSPATLIADRSIESVGFLKIDAEGMDCQILDAWFDQGGPLPDKVQIEKGWNDDWGKNTPDQAYLKVQERMRGLGYPLRETKGDAIWERVSGLY